LVRAWRVRRCWPRRWNLHGSLLEVVGAGARGFELAQQGEVLPSHGLLDEWEPANAARKPGKYSRRWERSLLQACVQSQAASCWARASTAVACELVVVLVSLGPLGVAEGAG
jgi:hypothetical protein